MTAYKNKYHKLKQQHSEDGGITWQDTLPQPALIPRGELIEEASDDCNTVTWEEVPNSWFCVGGETLTRWTITNTPICVGYDQFYVEKEQTSDDGGATWQDSGATRPSEVLIGYDMDACTTGVEFKSKPFTIESVDDGNVIGFDGNEIQVSTSGTSLSPLGSTSSVTLNKGDVAYFIRTVPYVKDSMSGDIPVMGEGKMNTSAKFTSSKRIKVYGNVFSLYVGLEYQQYESRSDLNQCCINLSEMFRNQGLDQVKVVSARNLYLYTGPAYHCEFMFQAQTDLINIPKTLPIGRFFRFYNERGRVNSTCACMFYGCTSITNAGVTLSGNKLGDYENSMGHFESMFAECENLITPPVLPATYLQDACYSHMFQNCTSLTVAPDLDAANPDDECYAYMFDGCTSLRVIKCLLAHRQAPDCTKSWVRNVGTEGTFNYNPQCTSWTLYGIHTVPYQWDFVPYSA